MDDGSAGQPGGSLARHASGVRFGHLDSTLADLPTVRSYIARMRIRTDMARTLLDDTIAALETGRADMMLRVLSCKAAAGEAAIEVLETGMRVCGGAAYRKDLAVERYFRDGDAARGLTQIALLSRLAPGGRESAPARVKGRNDVAATNSR